MEESGYTVKSSWAKMYGIWEGHTEGYVTVKEDGSNLGMFSDWLFKEDKALHLWNTS
jgi:hypothetical protein